MVIIQLIVNNSFQKEKIICNKILNFLLISRKSFKMRSEKAPTCKTCII